MVRNRLLLLTVLFFLPLAALAQTGVYGEFSGAGLGVGDKVYGGTFGLYSDAIHAAVVSLGFDVRGEFLTGNGQSLNSGLGGLRLAAHPQVLPLKPYVEALGGVGHADTVLGSSTHAEYRIAGGVDWTIFPRIDWRVVDVSRGASTRNIRQTVLRRGHWSRLP
jgi:hypothetical protein